MWREARYHRILYTAVAHLLSPHLDPSYSLPGLIEDLTGGDPEGRILAARRTRLARLRQPED